MNESMVLIAAWESKIVDCSGCVNDSNIGNFSIDDGDGSKNVTSEMNSRFFKLCRVYSNSLKRSNVGEFPWRFLGTALKFRKRKKTSSSLVYVLHKT